MTQIVLNVDLTRWDTSEEMMISTSSNAYDEGLNVSLSSVSYSEQNFQEQPNSISSVDIIESTIYSGLSSRPFGTIEKILKKSEANDNTVLHDKIEMPREIVILRKIPPHPNIINLLYWMKIRPDEWVIMYEYYGLNLRDYLNYVASRRGTNGLREDESQTIVRQLLLACKHLEDYGIYHRNLKLENIVIGTDGSIKLIDFDLAIEVKENEQHIEKIGSGKNLNLIDVNAERGNAHVRSTYTVVFLELVVPPEMYGHITYKQSTAQIWVLGTILYQLFERIEPYRKERVSCNALGLVMFSKYNRPSEECVELMEWMLAADPDRRPQCIDDVLAHRWIN
ncbi:9794_t:CDS:1 [Paraglomus occultum]|uniref:9794_t:CDS:1 n=1 Tax=Paraglomus occultum TaxID=144539 RepID=A0A9N9CLQ4_9GLOM|nr:9794_t:CDS:1 [Paraglomus occultum]